MSMSPHVIATELILGTGPDDVALCGALTFDVADPYAVSLKLQHGEQSVVWTFARELLVGGLHEPTGDGDVHIWPCLSAHGSSVVMIELSSPDGELLVEASSRDVSEFLDAAARLVPIGSEKIDIDALITELLTA